MNAARVTSHLPDLAEPDTRQFWLATREHKLVYPVCRACGTIVFYPRAHCTGCTSRDLCYLESAQRGSVYTFTIIRSSALPPFSGRGPYVVAWIDLDEGFRMMSNVVGVPPDQVFIGQQVEVEWDDYDELSLPLFRPAAGDAGTSRDAGGPVHG
jgi:uncharacterized OB-fold protein